VRTAPAILDDPAAIAAVDASGMIGAIGRLGSDLVDGFAAGGSVEGVPDPAEVRDVVVAGMGGSAVPGDVVRSSHGADLLVPVTVCRGYRLPRACGPSTLVVAVSVSGNTKETLACYEQASRAGCALVAVSRGGELAARAAADGIPHVVVPAEIPVPRAAIGFLSGAMLGILERTGLLLGLSESVARTGRALDQRFVLLDAEVPTGANEAKRLAAWMGGRTPVMWATEGAAEAAALRWKNQLNENAKVPAFHAVLPELGHNEVEGWGPGAGSSFALVVLRHPGEPPPVAARVGSVLAAIDGAGLESRQVMAEGRDALEWLFWLVQLGDLASVYLAAARGVDPTPTPVLNALKAPSPQ
jgi:glucose/mannose-6-phosphate isomerase